MGGVIFRQNSEEAFRRFREAGVNTDEYMGEYGQKGFFLDVETGKIDASEFCRRMAEAAGRESVGWDEAQYCWLGFIRDVPLSRLHNLLKLKRNITFACLAILIRLLWLLPAVISSVTNINR